MCEDNEWDEKKKKRKIATRKYITSVVEITKKPKARPRGAWRVTFCCQNARAGDLATKMVARFPVSSGGTMIHAAATAVVVA